MDSSDFISSIARMERMVMETVTVARLLFPSAGGLMFRS